jgi:glycosyltransferase involved in cell wall biosynthesis
VAPFARAFTARGGELRVCCLKSIGGNPFEAELRAAGVPVTNLGARNLRDVSAFRRLLRLLREERIDLVHAHLAYASIWGALACRILGLPCVATLHVVPSGAPRHSREGIREALLVRALDRWAARVIAVSRAVREAWIERGGIEPGKIVVVGNGVEAGAFAGLGEREAVRRELGIEPGAPLAVTVSVLREGKGIEVLLDALPAVLADHPAARFLVAGDGPLKAILAARAARLGVGEKVIWAGFRRDVPALLAAGDLFVLPSLWDAYPTVLLEAMAAGLPVVSTRAGGIPEIVDDPRTGRLVPPGDAETLADAISGLLASPAEREALGRAARAEAVARFSVEGWVERLEGVYRNPHGTPFEASPPVPHSLTGEGGRDRTDLADRRPPFSAEPFIGVPPRPSGSGGQGVRPRRARRLPGDNPLQPPLRLTLVEFAGRGGMIHYAYQLCRALAAAGAEVALVTGRHYELDALPHTFRLRKILRLWDPKPAKEAVSAGPRRLRRLGRAAVHYREWLRLAFHLRRERPDLVLLGDIRFPGDLAPLLLLRLFGLRLADICHNVFPYAAGGFRRSALDRFLYRRIYRRFERVFVHFEANRREFLSAYGLPPERVVAIPHGNEAVFEELRSPAADAAALRRSLDLAPDEPVALLFGTLSQYKGADLLLRAFARVAPRVPRARLVIAGFPAADFDLAEHQDLARELGIADRVRWAPRYIDAREVAAWMDLASVAVFPYRAVYQSGVLAVAQTFGVPIVAAAVGAMAEAVEHGESGLLVAPGDIDALSAALLRILEDPDLARRLGERAQGNARERFGWDRIARILLDAWPADAAHVVVGTQREAPR